MATATDTHNRDMLEKLREAGYTIPELEEGYQSPSQHRATGRKVSFKSVEPDLAERLASQGYYQCSRCGRVLGVNHYTKNKRSCRDCNGLASAASNARVRGLAWSPAEGADESLKAAHPGFEADAEKAAEWAERMKIAEAEAAAKAAAEAEAEVANAE